MIEVTETLAYSDEKHCFLGDSEIAVVHACKHPCFVNCKNLEDKKFIVEDEYDLYLNMIDPDLPMFNVGLFNAALDFIDKQPATIVHCNKGLSRSASICLCYMAKRISLLPNDSYESAKKEFEKNFKYRPGRGIQLWLAKNWDNF